jgi:hypothetical protein
LDVAGRLAQACRKIKCGRRPRAGRLALLVLAAVLASAGVAMATVFGGPFVGSPTPRDCAYDPSNPDCSTTRDDTYGDTTPPSVTLTAPADGSATKDSSPEFAGTAGTDAGDGATVAVLISDGDLDYEANAVRNGSTYSTSGPYAGQWGDNAPTVATLPDGEYTAQAQQHDAAGNTGSSAETHFTIDTVKPTSSATSPASSGSGPIEVGYSADGTGSGLAEVDLYAQGPADSAFAKVGTDSTPAETGHHITYSPTQGDGDYAFYTVAHDKAGNDEDAPAGSDATTALDTSAPIPTLTSPLGGTSTNDSSPQFAGKGGTAPGDDPNVIVKLWPGSSVGSGDPDYTVLTSVDPSTGAYSTSGPFVSTSDSSSHPALPDGTYTAETFQSDNGPHTGHSAHATFTVDTQLPSSTASSPGTSASTAIRVDYVAGDSGGSGLDKVELYARAPGAGSFSKTATDPAPSSSGGHFDYDATAGDGNYAFYTLAYDKAGNVEAAPGSADATTALAKPETPPGPDETNPIVTITSPHNGQLVVEGASIQATYGCADPGGIASCIGPLPSGGMLDTDRLGWHNFTVSATDTSGHHTSANVQYRVLSRGMLTITRAMHAFRRHGQIWIDSGIRATCPNSGGPACAASVYLHQPRRPPAALPAFAKRVGGGGTIAGGKSLELVFRLGAHRSTLLASGQKVPLWIDARVSRGTNRSAHLRRVAAIKLKK